jgi:hypothetical protein
MCPLCLDLGGIATHDEASMLLIERTRKTHILWVAHELPSWERRFGYPVMRCPLCRPRGWRKLWERIKAW